MIRALGASSSNIWSLIPVPDTGLLNSYNFLSVRSVFCSNEVALVGVLDDLCMGAGHQREQARTRSLEFSALPPFSEGRKAGNGVNNCSLST